MLQGAKLSALTYVGGVNIFDFRKAKLIKRIFGLAPSRRSAIADRPYFKAFKTDPKSPAMIIEPGAQPDHRPSGPS